MLVYEKLTALHPEFDGFPPEELAMDDMVCPAQYSQELFGYDAICEAEKRTPGICRACQIRFMKTALPKE